MNKGVWLYSKVILSSRQKLMIGAVLCVCVISFVYASLALEFFTKALRGSVADMVPHIRIFPTSAAEAKRVIARAKSESIIARAGMGIVVDKDVLIVTRGVSEEIGKPGPVYKSIPIKAQFVGYPFESESYMPPVLLENVYTEATRSRFKDKPSDAPIKILTDMRENERKLNWCIHGRNIANMMKFGEGLANAFDVVTKDDDGVIKTVVFRSAGCMSDSAFVLDNSTLPAIIYAKVQSIEKVSTPTERKIVVDLSLKDSSMAQQLSGRLKEEFPQMHFETWEDRDPDALPILRGIRHTVLIGVGGIVVLSVIGLGILMSIVVLAKSRHLAIVYALGATPRAVRGIFILAGIRTTILAIVIGLVIGIISGRASIPLWSGFLRLCCGNVPSVLVHSPCSLSLFVLVILVACSLACWIPTWPLVKHDPVQHLRRE